MGIELKEEGDYIPVATLSPPVNDSCIKMGSDESHFNVSIIVRDKVTRQCPQTTIFEEKGDPKRIRTDRPQSYGLFIEHAPKSAAGDFVGRPTLEGWNPVGESE